MAEHRIDPPPLPSDEERRLALLRDLALADTPPEPVFDSLAQLAASVCEAPTALISLVDASRQWCLAGVGLDGVRETPRDQSFCARAILDDALMEVPDASADPRFEAHPAVLGHPHLRFYAGVPLRMFDGECLGTLCILDRVPRRLDGVQRDRLAMLARAVVQAFECRRRMLGEIRQATRRSDEAFEMLAHELRQPLNTASAALHGARALLAARGDAVAEGRLQRAGDVVSSFARALDNTLAAAALMAAGGPIAVQDTDIDTLLHLVVGDLPAAQRSRVLVQREGGSRTAAMDAPLLRLALRNLVANALRHAPGDAAVRVAVIDSDEPLGLLFEVADSGPGVAESVRAHLFERGRRGPGSSGQGLGLYVARRVMELHGGRAELAVSVPGCTVFRLLLPPVDEP